MSPLALVLAACAFWPSAAPLEAPWAWVDGGDAFFAFPVDTRETWAWNVSETDDGRLEYGWMAHDGSGPGGAIAGFHLFKRPGAAPESGTLAELLAAGQAGATEALLRPGPAGISEAELARAVSAEACEGGVLVRVQGREAFHALFGAQPERLNLVVALPGRPYVSVETHIEYR